MATAAGSMTLEEFLALPETKPYREFVCGEIKEKAMPGDTHSDIVFELIGRLYEFKRERPDVHGSTELRYLDRNEGRVYLPDVSVSLSPRPRDRGPVETPPDFAIEVLSPDDRAVDVNNKVQFYLRIGVRLVWVIDPDNEQLAAYRRDEPPAHFTAADVVTAGPVFPEFTLSLRELFDEVRES